MIIFENVSKTYWHQQKKVIALENINLQINKGEVFGVIGESGSGKSTLLRMMNTLEQPSQGMVKIDEVVVSQLNEYAQRNYRKRIGMIFQQFNLLSNLTIHENVALPLKLNKVYDEKRVQEMLTFVGLEHKGKHYPSQLSGGEKQRVGIARALITQPEILLCDEPTSALDGQNAYDITELLRKVNQIFQTTMVIVSHELNLIKQLCNRTVVLEQGHILETIKLEQTQQEQQKFGSYYERVRENLL
ncbi:MAG: ATP-binding cassette domain-containing protein [Lactobacillales bacterium]|jgi:D-methionine transport system ATP-binding protein|nr:ATP-binding cassette domain-containing protein [Lactobacillales bacterium]